MSKIKLITNNNNLEKLKILFYIQYFYYLCLIYFFIVDKLKINLGSTQLYLNL